MKKSKKLQSFLISRIAVSFILTILVIVSVFFYYRKHMILADKILDEVYNFGDIIHTTNNEFIKTKNLKLFKINIQFTTSGIKNTNSLISTSKNETLIQQFEIFKEEFYKIENYKYESLNNYSQKIENDLENLFIYSITLTQKAQNYKQSLYAESLKVNIVLLLLIIAITLYVIIRTSQNIVSPLQKLTDYTANLSINNEKHEKEYFVHFQEIFNLKREILKLKNRIVLENKKSQSDAINETIGEISENVSHIINNPLAIIETSIRIIQKKSNEPIVLNELTSIKEMINRISQTTIQMKGLINNVDKDNVKEFEVSRLQVLIELYFLTRALKNNINLNYKLEDDLTVYARENEVYTIVFELIKNCVETIEKEREQTQDFSKSDEILLQCYSENDNTIIKIVSSGKVDKANMTERLNKQSKTDVGLFSVSQMISKNCGSIEFDCEDKTIFTINLPSKSLFT